MSHHVISLVGNIPTHLILSEKSTIVPCPQRKYLINYHHRWEISHEAPITGGKFVLISHLHWGIYPHILSILGTLPSLPASSGIFLLTLPSPEQEIKRDLSNGDTRSTKK